MCYTSDVDAIDQRTVQTTDNSTLNQTICCVAVAILSKVQLNLMSSYAITTQCTVTKENIEGGRRP